MQQLSAQDASFLHLESQRTPMHIGSVAIYDQGSVEGGVVTFKSILAMMEERLGMARSFTERLVHVPMKVDYPYWVSDPDFDLEYHVRHIALPKPGDWRQLWIQVARLVSRPLDLERPLWEFTVVEGLDNLDGIPTGAYAIVSKIHHCAVDGVSGQEITAAIHDLEPDTPLTDPPLVRTDNVPTRVELLGRAAVNSIRQPLRVPSLIRETIPALGRLAQVASKDDVHLPAVPGRVPVTRFNQKVSPHRVISGKRFDLDDVKAIKNTVPGATINDAVLTICAGGIRRYLEHHGELPEESLTAMAPISVRAESEQSDAGNHVAAMVVRLRTDIADDVGTPLSHARGHQRIEGTHQCRRRPVADRLHRIRTRGDRGARQPPGNPPGSQHQPASRELCDKQRARPPDSVVCGIGPVDRHVRIWSTGRRLGAVHSGAQLLRRNHHRRYFMS